MRQGFLPLIAVLGVAVLGGCSRGESPVAEGTTTSGTRAVPASCSLMQPGTNVRYLLCYSGTNDHGSFWFRGRGRIPISTPTEAPGGHWSGGFLAGDTLLAQWTAECEVPYAFFVPARGGTPRLVTGERSMENAPASIAHGWTISGEAIIEVIPNCSEATPHAQSELWLISPDGEQRRVRALPD